MKYSKEDIQKIKLPLSRETFLGLKKNGPRPLFVGWPKELMEEYARVQSEFRVEENPDRSDWE